MVWTTDFNETHARELIRESYSDDLTPLERDVVDWILDNSEGYDLPPGQVYDAPLTAWESMRGLLSDLAYGGCASGMVSHLIYYSDLAEYWQAHKSEISQIMSDLAADCGCSIGELFRADAWDNSDPLANEHINQGLLCWAAFEEIAHRIASALEMDI